MAAATARLTCPTFTGKPYDPVAAAVFLDAYENYADAFALAPEDKIKTLTSALRDDALAWLRQQRLLQPDDTWEETKTAFKDHFTAPVPRVNRAAMAAGCVQGQNEDMRRFLVRAINIAFEILPPPKGDDMPAISRTVGEGANAQDVNVVLREAEVKSINRYYVRQRAMDLVVAGCHESIRKHLLLDKSWSTWEELRTVAIALEQSIRPQALQHQMDRFGKSAPTLGVNQIGKAAAAAPPPPLPPPPPPDAQGINPVGQTTKTGRGRGRSSSNAEKPPMAAPDPQQHRTHSSAVKCYYCHGLYHTERHCLARQKRAAQGAAAVSSLQASTAAPPPPPPLPPSQPAMPAHAPMQVDANGFAHQTQQQQHLYAAAAASYPQYAAADGAVYYAPPGFPSGE